MEDHAYKCVIHYTKKYNIDESHALKHSIEVARFAHRIYESEVDKNPQLVAQKNIIIASAILHDMCDRKYVSSELTAICDICEFMKGALTEDELNIVVSIITTMSYSKVKQKGYPDLGEYQLAFHIVREADLLAAYDIDRCVMYGMLVENLAFTESVARANMLFKERVMKYREDGLFITDWSKAKSLELHNRNL
jgi:HD superfamily phosphodiesterase